MIQINHVKIKKKRNDYGYTQKKLAELSNVKAQSTISRLENGTTKDSITEFFRVIYSLDLEISDVIEIYPCEKRKVLKDLKTFHIERNFKDMKYLLDSKPFRFWNKDNELFCHYYWSQAIVSAVQEEYIIANIFIDKVIKRIKETKHYTYLLPEILIAKGNIVCGLGHNPIKYYKEADNIYNLESTLTTYQMNVRIHYAFANGYYKQKKFLLSLNHLNVALKDINRHDSNFLRLEIEWFKFILFTEYKQEEVDTQKNIVIGLATSFDKPEYLEKIKKYAYTHK